MNTRENIVLKYPLRWLRFKNMSTRVILNRPRKSLVVVLVPRKPELPSSTINSSPELWDVVLVKMSKLNLPGGDILCGSEREDPFDAACRELQEETLSIFDSGPNISNIDMRDFGVDFYYTVSEIHYPVRVFLATVSYDIKENLDYINSLYKERPNGETFGIKLVSLADLIAYVRRRKNKTINQTSFTDGKFKKNNLSQRVFGAIQAIFL
jgi:8-oxo-dGTP pyrophosphatase MutT (NUDIX family)